MFCCGSRSKVSSPRSALAQLRTQARKEDSVRSRPWETKNKLLCTFCGGDGCPHENYRTHPSPAIAGLNSDWVASDILATQRLSSRLIKRFHLMTQFTREGIKAVFNLQLPGEHPYCGNGIGASGFSYSPEELNEAGIAFYNQGWPDMKTPDMEHMVNTVQLMMFALQDGGKIAVHCHAGYGRTGVAIACLQMFRMPEKEPAEVISEIRKHRKKCIQTKKQQLFVHQFYKRKRHSDLQASRVVFTASPVALRDHLKRQEVLLHGVELKQTQHCPKIVTELCAKIRELTGTDNEGLVTALLSESDTQNIENIKKEINQGVWKSVAEEQSVRVLVHLLLAWLDTALLDPPLYLNSTVVEVTRCLGSLESVTYTPAVAAVLSRAKFTLLQTVIEKVASLIPAPCAERSEAALARISQSLQGGFRTGKKSSPECVALLFTWSRKAVSLA